MFKDVKAAAHAYDIAATFVSGQRAILNFPTVDYSDASPPRQPPAWLVDYVVNVEKSQGLVMSAMAKRFVANMKKPHKEA